jgi:hypothetical protein
MGLRGEYISIEMACRSHFQHIMSSVEPTDRRAFAELAKKSNLAPVLFNMLDGKDYSRHIWKMVEPKGITTFKVDEV